MSATGQPGTDHLRKIKEQLGASTLVAQLMRFVSAGAINTLATLALYQILLFVMLPVMAYVVAWLTGFVAMLIIYPKFVFPTDRLTAMMIVSIAAIYGGSLLAGSAVLYMADTLGITARLAVFASVALGSGLNFVGLRLLLGPKTAEKPMASPSPKDQISHDDPD